jgi:type II restriction enzyme
MVLGFIIKVNWRLKMVQASLNKYLEKTPSHWKKKGRIFGEACEFWVADNVPCLSCGSALDKNKTNEKSVDLTCGNCGEKYQVKATAKSHQRRDGSYVILGGEYNTTIENISTWNILLVEYSGETEVGKNEKKHTSFGSARALRYIDKNNIHKKNVLPRPPLGPHARRAGWEGCNLKFKNRAVQELWKNEFKVL